MWKVILEIVGLFLFSSIKFLFAPAASHLAGFNFLESLIITTTGGWFGVFVFYFTGAWIFQKIAQRFSSGKRPKKKFSRKNRFVIRVKNAYGLAGLSALMGLISIPVACLLAAKYYRFDRRTLPLFMASVLIWSLALNGAVHLFGLGV